MIKSLFEKGFFHLLATRFLSQFLGFGTVLIIAKFLSPIELGEVKILQSYTRLVFILAGIGMSTGILKICAENRPLREREGILRHVLVRSSITAFITLFVFQAVTLTGIVTSSSRLSHWLIVYALVIPLLVYTETLTSFLVALKKIKEMARAQAIIKIQFVIVRVLATWKWGFSGFVYATIAAYIIGLLPFFKHVGLNFFSVRDVPMPEEFMRISLLSMLVNVINTLGQYGDIFILDHFTSDRKAIGCYSLATFFILGAMQVTNTATSIATPYFSERAHDRVWSKGALIRTQLHMSALSAVVAVAVYGIASFLVSVFYGTDYKPALFYLAILLIRYFLWSSCAIIGVSLFGQGLVHYNFIISIIFVPAGLIFSYFMLKYFGIAGVAWAQVYITFFILISYLFICRVFVWRPSKK